MSRHLHARSQLDFNFPDILPDWILQPQDLNTDGIDPIGRDIHIHDCIIFSGGTNSKI